MNIPTLIEKYGRVNRLVGDYRACVVRTNLGTANHQDAKRCQDMAMFKLAGVENTLEDMGLLNADDRQTNREDA